LSSSFAYLSWTTKATFKRGRELKQSIIQRQTLEERGCYVEKTKFQCSPKCPEAVVYPQPMLDQPPCCLARILSNHQDFYEQKSAIETLIKGRGHKYVFLPKFHCELNPIEMYWGYSKARYRQVKKTSFDHAKKEVVIALDACTVDTLRRFCNRTFRFIDVYRKGLSIKAAAWCVKKQRRYRTITEEAMKAFKEYQKDY
jgi:hypothetical protein